MKKIYEQPVIETHTITAEKIMLDNPSVAYWGFYDDVDGRLDRIED